MKSLIDRVEKIENENEILNKQILWNKKELENINQTMSLLVRLMAEYKKELEKMKEDEIL